MDTYQLKDVLGHDDIAPGRKTDPGPAFPMGRLRAQLLGRGEDVGADLPYADEQLFTTATRLNVRIAPSSAADKLLAGPLPQGTRIAVLAEHGLWRRVDVLDPVGDDPDLEGWVHGRFLHPT